MTTLEKEKAERRKRRIHYINPEFQYFFLQLFRVIEISFFIFLDFNLQFVSLLST